MISFMNKHVIIRYARLDDAQDITEIYNHYIEHTTITFDLEPFSLENRIAWIEHHDPKSRHRLLVAEIGGSVVGYACSSKFRDKAAYDTSVETSVYLHPAHTGCGLGTILYQRLFEALEETDIHRVYACITVPNETSVHLHTKFGFTHVGVFTESGFKFGKYLDIQWMEKAL